MASASSSGSSGSGTSSSSAIRPKLRPVRDAMAAEIGLTLPVHLGISGVVDKTKLLTMGARLGIGDSLKYLRKNAGAVVKLMTSVNYDPNDLLLPLSDDLLDLGVEGIHMFTFNQVAATNEWREAVLAG